MSKRFFYEELYNKQKNSFVNSKNQFKYKKKNFFYVEINGKQKESVK